MAKPVQCGPDLHSRSGLFRKLPQERGLLKQLRKRFEMGRDCGLAKSESKMPLAKVEDIAWYQEQANLVQDMP